MVFLKLDVRARHSFSDGGLRVRFFGFAPTAIRCFKDFAHNMLNPKCHLSGDAPLNRDARERIPTDLEVANVKHVSTF
jgi:hypothetical protein